tara:strand:- start:2126 stop:2305 length:180 start_codon:yes stop_codon:yes gene_type:complete
MAIGLLLLLFLPLVLLLFLFLALLPFLIKINRSNRKWNNDAFFVNALFKQFDKRTMLYF